MYVSRRSKHPLSTGSICLEPHPKHNSQKPVTLVKISMSEFGNRKNPVKISTPSQANRKIHNQNQRSIQVNGTIHSQNQVYTDPWKHQRWDRVPRSMM
jgi:hypothetical protein